MVVNKTLRTIARRYGTCKRPPTLARAGRSGYYGRRLDSPPENTLHDSEISCSQCPPVVAGLSFRMARVRLGGWRPGKPAAGGQSAQPTIPLYRQLLREAAADSRRQYLYLPWDPAADITDVDTFRKQILLPILRLIHQRRLGNQIDAIVYSSDFPWAVKLDADIPKLLEDSQVVARQSIPCRARRRNRAQRRGEKKPDENAGGEDRVAHLSSPGRIDHRTDVPLATGYRSQDRLFRPAGQPLHASADRPTAQRPDRQLSRRSVVRQERGSRRLGRSAVLPLDDVGRYRRPRQLTG